MRGEIAAENLDERCTWTDIGSFALSTRRHIGPLRGRLQSPRFVYLSNTKHTSDKTGSGALALWKCGSVCVGL